MRRGWGGVEDGGIGGHGSRHPTAPSPMALFRIEILSNGEWTDDASLLGHGCKQSDNEFTSDLEAINAIDELVEVGFRRDDLRFVEID